MTTQGDNKKQKDTIGSTKHAEKDSREEQRPSGLTRSSPLTRLYRIIQNTANAEIPKRNFSYRANPLVLLYRIFRG
jgi:hypothetical protein